MFDGLFPTKSVNTHKHQLPQATMSLANQVFVFAGFTDETLKAQIEAAGGKVTTTLSKSVTKMLAKSLAKKNGNGELKKVEEAKKHDVEVVLLDEFVAEHDFSLGEKKARGRPPKSPKGSDDEAEPKAASKPAKAESPKAESPKAAKPSKAAKAAPKPAAKAPREPMELVSAVVNALAYSKKNDDISEALEALEAIKALLLAA